jgi:hypothetical protein
MPASPEAVCSPDHIDGDEDCHPAAQEIACAVAKTNSDIAQTDSAMTECDPVDPDLPCEVTRMESVMILSAIEPARWVGVRFIQMYTFFAAPAKDDLALLIIVYLVFVHGKTPGQVGSLQAVRDFGVAIGSVGAGYIIDKSNHKLAIAAAANMTSIVGVIILLSSVDMGPLPLLPFHYNGSRERLHRPCPQHIGARTSWKELCAGRCQQK